MNVELPPAASLERTNKAMRQIDEILKHEPGIHYYNAVSGFSIRTPLTVPPCSSICKKVR